MKRFAMRPLVLGLALSTVLGTTVSARADNFTFSIGGLDQSSYAVSFQINGAAQTATGGAGNFSAATLVNNTTSTTYNPPFVYCVDLNHDIGLGSHYSTPNLILNSTDFGAPPATGSGGNGLNISAGTAPGYITDFVSGSPNLGLALNYNAKAIAALVGNVAVGGASGSDQNIAGSAALQVAIWNAEYNPAHAFGSGVDYHQGWDTSSQSGFTFTSLSSLTATQVGLFNTAYAADLALITANGTTAAIASSNFTTQYSGAITGGVLFINSINNDGTFAQALVTRLSVPNISNSPVPGTLVMSCILFGMFGMVWSYKRVNQWKAAA